MRWWILETLVLLTVAAGPAVAQDACTGQKVLPVGSPVTLRFDEVGGSLDPVALSGEWAIATALRACEWESTTVLYHWNGTGWVQHQELAASGYSAAISDDVALVKDQVYRRGPDDVWTFEQLLEPALPPVGSSWIRSCSIVGDLAVLGYPYHERVIVFRFDAITGEWTQEAALTAFDGAANDFGTSVSLSADTILVGAPHWYPFYTASGAAYVFRYDATTGSWLQEQKLTASDGFLGDRFGWAVSLSSGVALVGAPGDGLFQEESAAYVYHYDPVAAVWGDEVKLAAVGGGDQDTFGWAVSLWNDVAFVGAPGVDGPDCASAGSVYVYRQGPLPTVWTLEQAIPAELGDYFFGVSVCVSESRALVRNSLEGPWGYLGTDHAFQHDVTLGTWIKSGELATTDGIHLFGGAVAVEDDIAVVGTAPSWSLGAVDVFRRESGVWAIEQSLSPSGLLRGDRFGGSVSIDDGVIAVGAPGPYYGISYPSGVCFPPSPDFHGRVHLFSYDHTLSAWVEDQVLTDPGSLSCALFGLMVSISGDVLFVGRMPNRMYCTGDQNTVEVFHHDPDLGWFLSQTLPTGHLRCVSVADDVGAVVNEFAISIFRRHPVTGVWTEEQELPDVNAVCASVQGERLLAGVPWDDTLGLDAGAVHFFRHDAAGGVWIQEESLYAADGGEDEFFGRTCTLKGDLALVGANSGTYLFQFDSVSGTWIEMEKLEVIGEAVALSSDTALVGMPFDDDACPPACDDCDSGAVTFVDLSACLPLADFIRGDANSDGEVDLGDAISTLNYLFGDGIALCLDAADANDDGLVDLGDPIYSLTYSFSSGAEPPAPFPDCGFEPTDDGLGCVEYDACP